MTTHLFGHVAPHLVGRGVDDFVVEQARSGQKVSRLNHADLAKRTYIVFMKLEANIGLLL
jgi:hypothetical protein